MCAALTRSCEQCLSLVQIFSEGPALHLLADSFRSSSSWAGSRGRDGQEEKWARGKDGLRGVLASGQDRLRSYVIWPLDPIHGHQVSPLITAFCALLPIGQIQSVLTVLSGSYLALLPSTLYCTTLPHWGFLPSPPHPVLPSKDQEMGSLFQ